VQFKSLYSEFYQLSPIMNEQIYHSQDISMLSSLYFEEGRIHDAYGNLAIVAKSGKIPTLEFSLLGPVDILTKAFRLCGVHTRRGQT